jgi:hypothetical protein
MSLGHNIQQPQREYAVFKVKEHLLLQDPDETSTRYHTVIFVETDQDGSGWIHQVAGDITTGMQYERKRSGKPEASESHYTKQFLGHISVSDYPAAMDTICQSIPPPHKQKAYNAKTNRTEACKADGTFYGLGETRPPFFKCTEWTEQKVIPALLAQGVMKTA